MPYHYTYWLTQEDPYRHLSGETREAVRLMDINLGLTVPYVPRHRVEWTRTKKKSLGCIVAEEWGKQMELLQADSIFDSRYLFELL